MNVQMIAPLPLAKACLHHALWGNVETELENLDFLGASLLGEDKVSDAIQIWAPKLVWERDRAPGF